MNDIFDVHVMSSMLRLKLLALSVICFCFVTSQRGGMAGKGGSCRTRASGEMLSNAPEVRGKMLANAPEVWGKVLANTPELRGKVLANAPVDAARR